MSFKELLLQAQEHKKAGRLPQADALCRHILSSSPQCSEAWYLWGTLASISGNSDAATTLLRRAIDTAHPPSADLHYDLANLLQSQGHDREALFHYAATIRLHPEHVYAYSNQGSVFSRLGRLDEAIASFQSALQINPHLAAVYYNLGNAYKDQGKQTQAIESYQKAIDCLPEQETTLKSQVHNNWGLSLSELRNYNDAITHFQQAIAIAPESCEANYNYGSVLSDQGERRLSLDYFQRALTIKPLYPEAKWASAIAHIPAFFETSEAIDPARADFDKALNELDLWFDSKRTPLGSIAVGASQPFYLAFQDRNNRPLLQKYGNLCSRLMKDWWDRQKRAPPSTHKASTLKVGLISSYFYDHSVWHAIIKGWLKHFDRQKIEIHIFKIGFLNDDETQWAIQNVSSFQTIGPNLQEAVEKIQSKDLSAIIYPEIGMNPLALKLASLRLCPLQMTSWGHPETSGLPTQDYYLSAEAFEPPDADQFYTEKLVRLPNLGCSYQPLETIIQDVSLDQLGIRAGVPLLLSAGQSHKYMPEHDHVFVEIARKLRDCQIVFFTGRLLSEKFSSRLRRAFDTANLPFDQFCVFIPWQKRPLFYGLMKRATLFLDTLSFSGFNTAIQAIECALPVVAYEGRFMRGRLASGILRRMNLSELIASTKDDFVNRVVALAQNSEDQKKIRRHIMEQRSILFEDIESVRALEAFLLKTAHQMTKD